jgi:hypothetical protein
MLTVLGGSDCVYVAGGALMLAECSLWRPVRRSYWENKWGGQNDLTILALPHKICFAPAAAHFILLETTN